jgi:hypothetical protein
MDYKQFVYAELECCEIGGTVDVKTSYRGSKGKYQSILNTRVLAVTENYQWENTPVAPEVENLGFLNTQYRRLITESTTRNADSLTCESKLTTDIDKAFSILIEWCGEFGLETIRMFQDPWSERSTGVPQTDEELSCVVAQDGTALLVDLFQSPYETQDTKIQAWNAKVYQSVSLLCNQPLISVTATASASFLSNISFVHAEEQATILAEQAARSAAQQYILQNPC